jgi:hypothetical protein
MVFRQRFRKLSASASSTNSAREYLIDSLVKGAARTRLISDMEMSMATVESEPS